MSTAPQAQFSWFRFGLAAVLTFVVILAANVGAQASLANHLANAVDMNLGDAILLLEFLAATFIVNGLLFGSYINLAEPGASYAGSDSSQFSTGGWSVDYTRPLGLNAWLYALDNPVYWVDPTGHTSWPAYNIKAIQNLKPAILDSAHRHNTAQSGFTDEAFAALMAAHINRESKFGPLGIGVFGNTLQSWGYDQFFDCLGFFGYNASTGIANIRPSVAIETLRGALDVYPHSSGYTVQGSGYQEFIRKNTRVIGGITVIPGDQDPELQHLVFLELQDPVLSVEYLAANTERGVDRAIGKGIVPSVFNLGSWFWQGVQTRDEFEYAWRVRHEKLNVHGAALVSDMPMAFQVLGLPATPYNAFNPYEADLVSGSFYNSRP